MLDEERSRILRMVSEGQIAPEDAADLLEALEESARPEVPVSPVPPLPAAIPPVSPHSGRRSRVLVIQVRDGGDGDQQHGTKVNLRIPLGLAKAAGKFIPRSAENVLKAHDIDLQDVMQEFLDSQASGPIIHIQDGSSRVLIAVE